MAATHGATAITIHDTPEDVIKGPYNKTPENSNGWDQRDSLKPPIFVGPMARIVKGFDIGDPRIDALPPSALSHHGGEARKISMDPHPDWVDWESVRRGQKAFRKLIGPAYVALAGALLQGFSIGRFAEVLIHNGYAQNAMTAFERYRDTSFAIIDWMSHPIDDKDSRAQLQLQNVRAMHAFARRRSKKLFDESKGEGLALSQYDMAEVLIGFAGVAPDIMMHEFGINLDYEDRRDMCHTWRLIGYHLGIMDEYNPCTSLEELEAIMNEWMPYTPLRFITCRPATHDLQRSALEGFGKYTGLGVELFAGALHASCETRDWGTTLDYLQRPCLPGMKEIVKSYLPIIGNSAVAFLLGFIIVKVRGIHNQYPRLVKRCQPCFVVLSNINDTATWPVLSKVAGLVTRLKWLVLGIILTTLSTVSLVLCIFSLISGIIHAITFPWRCLRNAVCN